MAILHGSWLLKNQNGCLFIWGETWRSSRVNFEFSSSPDVPPHPLAMTPVELSEWLRSRSVAFGDSQNITIANLTQQAQVSLATTGRTRKGANATEFSLPIHSQIISLPTYISESNGEGTALISPVHSASAAVNLETEAPEYLQPWRVEGFCLNPAAAIKFLTSLPLNAANGEDAFLGGDLRFWSQVARWSLDLISRCKFLPTMQRQSDDSIVAKWQVLLDSAVDGTRLEKFSAKTPLVCRTYQGERETGEEFSQSPIPNPQSLLYLDPPNLKNYFWDFSIVR
jgi:hypothetical protein